MERNLDGQQKKLKIFPSDYWRITWVRISETVFWIEFRTQAKPPFFAGD